MLILIKKIAEIMMGSEFENIKMWKPACQAGVRNKVVGTRRKERQTAG